MPTRVFPKMYLWVPCIGCYICIRTIGYHYYLICWCPWSLTAEDLRTASLGGVHSPCCAPTFSAWGSSFLAVPISKRGQSRGRTHRLWEEDGMQTLTWDFAVTCAMFFFFFKSCLLPSRCFLTFDSCVQGFSLSNLLWVPQLYMLRGDMRWVSRGGGATSHLMYVQAPFSACIVMQKPSAVFGCWQVYFKCDWQMYLTFGLDSYYICITVQG